MFDDPNLFPFALAAAVVVAFLVGAAVGRRTGEAQKKIEALEARVAGVAKERDLSKAAAEAAQLEVARVRGEFREYREGVVEHFTGTSGLLRDLTRQYRAVYEHLTAGATTLCPKGSIDQLEALRVEQLPEAGGPSKPAAPARPSASAPAGSPAGAGTSAPAGKTPAAGAGKSAPAGKAAAAGAPPTRKSDSPGGDAPASQPRSQAPGTAPPPPPGA